MTHSSSISSLATFVLLLDLAGISTEFFWGSGVITTQFCFTYSLDGVSVTAMPRGLHARLCHAFLLVILKHFFDVGMTDILETLSHGVVL